MSEPQNTLRDALTEAFDKAELQPIPDAPVQEAKVEETLVKEDRPRDESGKFAPKVEAKPEVKAEIQAADIQEKPVSEKPLPPSTWKKEYREGWEKLDPRIAAYINQRENEYKSGVSTYKAEAENAKVLNEAMSQFMPDLQRNGINPVHWITNLGNAHRTLALGSPEQKVMMFRQLAQQYGIQLDGMQQQEPNWMAQQLSQVQNQINEFKSAQQRAEMAQYQKEINSYTENTEQYPHFERLREPMAQLLEKGLANDLKTAYKMAERMDDEIYESRLGKLQQDSQAKVQQKTIEAKAKVISPKTSSPKGQVVSNAKDRRAMLEEAFSSAERL